MKIRQAKINGEQGWVLDYGIRDGKRRREYFHSEDEASGALDRATKDAAAIGRKWANLKPERRSEVVTILAEIDAAGRTLREVWEGFKNGSSANLTESKALDKAIDDLVTAKTGANRRQAYVDSLEQYLRRWSKGQETKPIATVTLDEIDTFLNALPSLSSRATAINRLSTLFSFAVRKGWRVDNPLKRVERPHIDNGTPEILTVEQARKALEFTRQNMKRFLPWLSLALFAGIRPEEADKLTWKDIDLDRGIVTVGALAAKVRRRRIVHLKPAAVAWLKLKGDLPLPRVTRRRCLRKLRDLFGWTVWKKDVLRHTAASNWLASDQDAARVAMELGNSPSILFKHYRELVTDEQAKEFWAIMPPKSKGKKGGRK